jgi:hypothetical protein
MRLNLGGIMSSTKAKKSIKAILHQAEQAITGELSNTVRLLVKGPTSADAADAARGRRTKAAAAKGGKARAKLTAEQRDEIKQKLAKMIDNGYTLNHAADTLAPVYGVSAKTVKRQHGK